MTASAAAAVQRPSLRFRGRSFLALVLAPEPPAEAWFAELDALIKGSPGFFTGRAVILDVSALDLDRDALAGVVARLSEKGVRLMGLQGAKASQVSMGMPPLISGGRDADAAESAEMLGTMAAKPEPEMKPEAAAEAAASSAAAPAAAGGAAAKGEAKADAPAAPPQTAVIRPFPTRRNKPTLMIETPVRSGQSIIYTEGDVTVLGSVASGAEIVAGGSIHIYGALRGRAIAGSTGNGKARIFCRKLEPELVAIDGLYKTAEDLGGSLRGQPAQLWLEGDKLMMAAL